MRSSCELLLYFIYFFLAFVENADFKKFLFTSSAEMRQFSSLLTHFYDLKAYDRHKCKKFFIIISHLHTNGNFMLQSQKFFITFIFSSHLLNKNSARNNSSTMLKISTTNFRCGVAYKLTACMKNII